MIFPLIVLAVGAVIGGLFNWHESIGHFLGRSPSLILTQETAEKNLRGAHAEVNPAMLGQPDTREPEVIDRESSTEKLLMFSSAAIALAGLGLAYQFHLKNRPAGEALPRRFPLVARVLENKYWVDEIYQAAIVEPLWRLGQFFYAVDRIVIDGIVWLVGFVPQLSGFTLKLTTQRGYLQGYAGAMALGIVIILLIVFW